MKPITINSILGGQSEAYYLGSRGSFLSSIACDPDQAIPGQTKASGAIVPVGYSKFSSTGLTGYPKWILTNPKSNDIYVYSTAEFLKYDSTLTTETGLGSPTSGAGNGAAYYNDYIYLATATNVSRYGLLSGSPGMTNNWWTSLGLTALSNTAYPSLKGTPIPNHPMFAHTDNSVYVGDVVSGQGVLHRIITTASGANDGSAYNVIDFPAGYYPTCIANYGLDLVIGCIQTSSDTTISQGKAALIFWETTNVDTFYRIIHLADPLVTAIKNVNGTLYVWTGNANGGTRLSKYLGGDVLQQVSYHSESLPPFQGAVDSIGSKLVWGGFTTDPASSASVFSYGSFNQFPAGLHNIARSTSNGTNQNVTALKIVNQNGRMAIGSGSDTDKQLDKYSSSATLNSVWRSQVFSIGAPFEIKEIRLQFGGTVSANTTITGKVYYDDGSSSESLRVINSTNFANSERTATLYTTTKGNNNFFLEFVFTGTSSLPIVPLITITYSLLKSF